MQDPKMQESPDVEDPAMSDDESTAAKSYVIEITVSPDGITVGVESASDESAEESTDAAPTDPSQPAAEPKGEAMPAKDIKDAMVMALMIYKNDGEMPESDQSADDDFAQGYKSR